MRIRRILTNNALVVLDEKGKEQIVCGKGIGYKKRPGDNVDDKLVETVYVKEGDQSFEQIRRKHYRKSIFCWRSISWKQLMSV